MVGVEGWVSRRGPAPMKTKDLFLSALCIEFSYHFSFEEFAGYKSMWKPTAYQAESSPIGSLPDTGLQNTRVPHLFLRAHSSQFCFRLPGMPGCPVLFPIQVLPLLYGVRLKSQILEKLFPVSSTLGPLPPLNCLIITICTANLGSDHTSVFPDLTSSYTFNSFSTGVGLTFPKSGNPCGQSLKVTSVLDLGQVHCTQKTVVIILLSDFIKQQKCYLHIIHNYFKH